MNSFIKRVYLSLIASCMFVSATVCFAAENATDDPLTARVIGVLTLEKTGASHVFKQVDRLVPELKKMPSDKIIRLDCSYKGFSNNEKDVRAAYSAAAKIEKYLREHHKLKLDLWISARLNQGKKGVPRMVISVLSDEINQYQKLPVNPGNEKP